MPTVLSILALVLAYLIGGFPSAFVFARLRKGVDIRQVGSHNMGAMNTFYSVGFWWGMLVLILDMSKGAAAVAVAWQLTHTGYIQLIAGAVAVVGHGFPVYLKFKGGKGGAACIGILAYVMPWGIPVYPAVFGLVLLATRFPTLSYSAAFLAFPVLAAFVYHSITYIIFSLGILLLPGIRYLPRIFEMRRGAGGSGWRHVFVRRSLKDRL